ncbi:MAG TPA: nickel-binding protein, partial [Burkholderiaceae bacterium]|nr:nickel-binding protein [Burkholderiaceae bacterium]
MAQQLIWLRSYVVREDDHRLGTFCLFQSVGPDVLVEHARRVGMPADEVTPVLGRIVFREEPPFQPEATDAAAA